MKNLELPYSRVIRGIDVAHATASRPVDEEKATDLRYTSPT